VSVTDAQAATDQTKRLVFVCKSRDTFTYLLMSAGHVGLSCRPVRVGLNAQSKAQSTRIWADAQRDVRPAEYRWRPLLNAAKFG